MRTAIFVAGVTLTYWTVTLVTQLHRLGDFKADLLYDRATQLVLFSGWGACLLFAVVLSNLFRNR